MHNPPKTKENGMKTQTKPNRVRQTIANRARFEAVRWGMIYCKAKESGRSTKFPDCNKCEFAGYAVDCQNNPKGYRDWEMAKRIYRVKSTQELIGYMGHNAGEETQ